MRRAVLFDITTRPGAHCRRRFSGAARALVLVFAVQTGAAADPPSAVTHNLDRPAVEGLSGEDRRIRSRSRDRVDLYVTGDPEAAAAVLVFHEWWGLTDQVRAEADRIAATGYQVAALDVYGEPPTGNPRVANRRMRELDTRVARRRARAALDYLRREGRPVAVLGWCFGGGQALDAAIESPELVTAVVAYYGDLETDVERLERLRAPVLAIYADQDAWITPARAADFAAAMAAAGRELESVSFAAGHAFANPTARDYDGEAASEARALVDAFLARHLWPDDGARPAADGQPGETP
jgi:carboxymethylenebutenolidase